jgi:hypothetical protein
MSRDRLDLQYHMVTCLWMTVIIYSDAATHADMAAALHMHHAVSSNNMGPLNEPITVDEVAESTASAALGKSADVCAGLDK